jgi:hypothetical protein
MAWSKTDWTARDHEWLTFHIVFRRWMLAALFLWPTAGHADCPVPVTPKTPPHGTVTTETRIDFSWSPTSADGYVLYLSRDGGPAKQAEGCANSPKPNCTVTLEPGRYEWFVRTRGNFGCPSECNGESAHYCLLIKCNNPVVPTNLKALPESDVPVQGTKLTWKGGGDDRYDVFLTPGQTCKTSSALNRTPLTETSLDSGPLISGAPYSWWVRASVDSSCAGPVFSSCETFTVRCVPTGEITGFKTDMVGAFVRLSWDPSPGAWYYRVSVQGGDEDPPSNNTEPFSCVRWNPFLIKWTVQAVPYGNCNFVSKAASAQFQENSGSKCDESKARPVAPSGELGPGTEVEFRWNAPEGFLCNLSYSVWLAPLNGTAKRFGSQVKTSSRTPSLKGNRPAPGDYTWYVTIDGHCGPESAPLRFTVPK